MKSLTKIILMAVATTFTGCKTDYNADIIIRNAYIITIDNEMNQYRNGSVVIKDSEIIAIGDSDELDSKYNSPEIIDGNKKLVMPGLINTHSHAAMTMFRGIADDIPLQEWLYEHIFPMEQEFVSAENVTLGSKLAIAEMLRSGTTTFNDMYYYVNETARVVDKTGIRALLSKGLIDFPVPNSPTPKEGMEKTIKLINDWKGHPRVNIAVAAHATYSCSPDLIVEAKKIADKYNIPYNIHVAETQDEVDTIKKRFGKTPVGFLNDLGVLSDNVIAAHCVHLTDEDIQLIAHNNVGVAHNPQCNMKIVSGIAPVPELIKAGAKVGIGTDGAASNNDLDMFDEMRSAAFIHKITSNDPTVLDAETVVKTATMGSAEVLGLDDQIGSLEIGKKADIIILDLEKPHAHPVYNIYSLIVYSLKGSDVETVIIDGKIVMKNRELINLKEDELYKKIDSLSYAIKSYSMELNEVNTDNNKK